MEPTIEKFLQGIPFAGMGTTLERNGLIGVVREMIKANKYTVEYILNYCESVGYQRKMAEEVFEELTGLSPKLIINNNEYYNAPIYVPACTIAWGIAKSKKDVAFYVVPGSYGYSVMEKNETESPIEVIQTATIPEAIDELKKVAKNIQTLDKIITSKLLETEDIQSSANNTSDTSKPYFSDPIRELKKNFKNKVIDINAFEREAKKLVAEEKITLNEAEDLMNWKQDLVDEDESYANEVLQHNEEWKPLDAEVDDDDFNGYHSSEEYLNSYEYLYETLVNGNITLYKEKLNKLSKSELMDYIAWAEEMGISREELKLHYITASKKQSGIVPTEKITLADGRTFTVRYNPKEKGITTIFNEYGKEVGVDAATRLQLLRKLFHKGEPTIVNKSASKKMATFNNVKYSLNDALIILRNNGLEYKDLEEVKETSSNPKEMKHALSTAIERIQKSGINAEESLKGYIEDLNNTSDEFVSFPKTENEMKELYNRLLNDEVLQFNTLEQLYIGESGQKIDEGTLYLYYRGHGQYAVDPTYENFKRLVNRIENRKSASKKVKSDLTNNDNLIKGNWYRIEDYRFLLKYVGKNAADQLVFQDGQNEFYFLPSNTKVYNKNTKVASKKAFNENCQTIINLMQEENVETDDASPNFVNDFAWEHGYEDLTSEEVVWISDNYVKRASANSNITVQAKKEEIDASLNKKASKKVTAENITLEDMEEEDNKSESEKELDKINETPIDELLEDNTPLDYFEKETQDDKVDTINDVVSKCITEFSNKFKDFNKYDIKMLSYKTKILDSYTPTKDEMISDSEVNADAVLQVILEVNNKADDTDIKKLLVVFSITDGKMHWTGTVRDEDDNVVAFNEEGLDSIFQEPEEIEEDII